MIGVVFVVVFMVLGLLIYVSLAMSNPNLASTEIRSNDVYGKALQTAMLETTVPSCHAPLGRVLIDCIESPYLVCGSTPVCTAAHDAWKDMLVSVLGDETTAAAVSYTARVVVNNDILSRDGTTFVLEPFVDCTENSRAYAAPRQQLPTRAGTAEFIVTFCQ